MIWPHVTKEKPCPVCGKDDWCTIGDRAVLCQRTPSEHAHPNGGWYHFFEKLPERPQHVTAPKQAPRQIDAAKMIRLWREKTSLIAFRQIAHKLGVHSDSVIRIGAAWAPEHRAWAFPMRDGHGETIGIRLRNDAGQKWAVTGSRQGLFYGDCSSDVNKVAYLPEGPTDTVAGMSIGLFCVGRPTCNSGGEHVKALLRRLGIGSAVIVADNDDMKSAPGGQARPGIVGAERLKRELGVRSVIWHPTGDIKDLREFVRRGGTRALIEAQIKDRVWSTS